MSEKGRLRFEPVAWALSPLLAVMLYVLTWPPIALLSVKKHHIASVSGGRASSATVTLPYPWVGTVYWPLDVLRAANGKGNVLERYHDWWRAVLKK
jgi:hypothetical protein